MHKTEHRTFILWPYGTQIAASCTKTAVEISAKIASKIASVNNRTADGG